MHIFTKFKAARNIFFIIAITAIVILVSNFPMFASPVSAAGGFTYTIPSTMQTSAGVYQNGTLIRTLWSNEQRTAGTYTAAWDGKNNDGTVMPAGTYEARVLTSNVTYTWEGVIGNNSDNLSGPGIWNGDGTFYGFAQAGNYFYVPFGYDEGGSSMYKFLISDPGMKLTVGPGGVGAAGYGEFFFAVSDGTNVYWGGDDAGANTQINGVYFSTAYYVHATRVSDNTEVSFPSGGAYKPANSNLNLSTIDLQQGITNGVISGMAVQQTGNYLFVSHALQNQLHVFNKTTGALIKNISVTTPASLAIDGQNNLWMINSNGGTAHVEKYTINTDGSLTLAGSITGLSNALSLAVSPDNSTLLVADGQPSEQVKAFSTASLSSTPLWTLGQQGGYANGPDVNNNKFLFDNVTGEAGQDSYTVGPRHEITFLAYQPDGTFWVRDTNNYRLQHYSATGSYVGTFMAMPSPYDVQAVQNDPTRILKDTLEFKIDYSKPLANGNGSWTLAKNWEWNAGSGTDLFSPVMMSNGRTYALVRTLSTPYGSEDRHEVVELSPTGARFTGVKVGWDGCGGSAMFDYQFWSFYPDGSCRETITGRWPDGTQTSGMTWRKQTLTGFDANNNPQWSAPANVVASPPLAETDPNSGQTPRPWEVTTTGIVGSYEGALGIGYHFGGLNTATGKWAFLVAPATGRGHTDNTQFPKDGAFDTGNNVTANTGIYAFAAGRSFFTNYLGENWGPGGETNMWNQYYDDGLMVGQFGAYWFFNYGTGRTEYPYPIPGAAGNECGGGGCSLVALNSNTAYIYHGDESQHGGIHRWKIDGLDTVQEQKIPITFDGTYVAPTLPAGTTDLLAGVPHMTLQTKNDPLYQTPVTDFFPTTLIDGQNSWHRTPASDSSTWYVNSGMRTYEKDKPADIFASFSGTNHSASVSRDLLSSSDSPVTNWAIDGRISYSGPSGMSNLNHGELNDGSGYSDGAYVEVLDDQGKIIARFYGKGVAHPSDYRMIGDGTTVVQSDYYTLVDALYRSPQHLNISAQNGQVTFTFGSYPPVTAPLQDSTANWQKPTTLRVYFWMGLSDYAKSLDLLDLKFSTNGTGITPPPTPTPPPPPPPPTPAAAPTVSLSVSPTSVTAGQSATLTWGSTNATSCTGVNFTASGVTGAVVVTPTGTTNYSVTCTGTGGSATASATVTLTTITPTPTPTPTPSTFSIGTRVKTIANLNVRSKASNGKGIKILCTQPAGSLGTIKSGPTSAGGYLWWNVDYDTKCDGWSVQNYLTATVAEATPETQVAGAAASLESLQAIEQQVKDLLEKVQNLIRTAQ